MESLYLCPTMIAQKQDRIVLIGAGRVATHLGMALQKAGYRIEQIFSRTEESAGTLARSLHTSFTTDLHALTTDADIYLFSIKDDVLSESVRIVLHRLRESRCSAALPLLAHTAGSMSLQVFEGYTGPYGILYPMQTFSVGRELDFQTIPCFLEACSAEAMLRLRAVAGSISEQLYELSSEQRRLLHVAAVFACNFSNHMYALAEELLRPVGIPFSALYSLIDETTAKVHELSPRTAQTGPACRYDCNVMQAHLDLIQSLSGKTTLSKEQIGLMGDLYERLSKSIHLLQK